MGSKGRPGIHVGSKQAPSVGLGTVYSNAAAAGAQLETEAKLAGW